MKFKVMSYDKHLDCHHCLIDDDLLTTPVHLQRPNEKPECLVGKTFEGRRNTEVILIAHNLIEVCS
jgi:hypothetical protein